MAKLLAEEVFKPGSIPIYTYVSRKSKLGNILYETRLRSAIKIGGFLTSIVGPSKMGKTILCKKVLSSEDMVQLSGVDFQSDKDFWSIVGEKAQMSISEIMSETSIKKENFLEEMMQKREEFILNKDKVIKFFNENKKVLVLDDFHFAPKDKQIHIAQQLKDAISKELKTIVISLPHRSDDIIRNNSDLHGRMSLIDIEPWTNEQLQEIARFGFDKLGIKVKNNYTDKLVMESLTSPQLMQSICLNLCTIIDSDNKVNVTINNDIIEEAFRLTASNLNFQEVERVFTSGPNTRGNKRKMYKASFLTTDKELDIYGLIVECILLNPPEMTLTLENIKNRIDEIVKDTEKPDKSAIRDSLNKLQSIIDEREKLYQVIEWKDNQLHILEPLFLFYLRWGR